jgi:hypothetical protein
MLVEIKLTLVLQEENVAIERIALQRATYQYRSSSKKGVKAKLSGALSCEMIDYTKRKMRLSVDES